MFKKTIEFEDFNGERIKREFYFHLSKAELLAMSGEAAGLQARIQRIVATDDVRAVLDEFRALIKMSVGVRSDDGVTFDKSPEAQATLLNSNAFDELLFELVTVPNASVEFANSLIPEKMRKEMEATVTKGAKDAGVPSPFGEDPLKVDPEDKRPAWLREGRNPTEQELREMSKEELQLAFQNRK